MSGVPDHVRSEQSQLTALLCNVLYFLDLHDLSNMDYLQIFCYLTGKTKVDLPNISLREDVQHISLSIYKHFSINISNANDT